ncbi:hypothetical protein [Nonomuraea sp. 10N515B]|uniref:hypothetical protein n=1 Tax=Nonomuraea sp. 10N515B TaxID=3457422 RepID=UPI003FCE64E2
MNAPWLQAEMLQAARLFRGAKVAEIGSGGYNAALIAKIVGPDCLVVSFDIDPWVVERATRFLTETGSPQVKVVLGDAEHTVEQHTPEGGFDGIIVTVGVYDIPWGHLLAPAGRRVVPLRFPTVSRSLTFIRDGDHFVGLDPACAGSSPSLSSAPVQLRRPLRPRDEAGSFVDCERMMLCEHWC